MKVLFVLKKNETYGFTSYCRRSSGLWNSTNFIVQSLEHNHIKTHIVEVIDNNCIDREVNKFKPDLVIIEALWVVPEKFNILKKLHPKVKWFVHLHSGIPFLAMEGIAMQWIKEYAKKHIKLIANSIDSYEALRSILTEKELVYLPNVYLSCPRFIEFKDKETIDVACFGAIRPLKNQLIQALAAIEFARCKKKKLRFHINSSRVETLGEPVLKNLTKLFENQKHAELVRNHWHEPEEFLNKLKHMDIGMQVSLTETFNVVTADYVTAGLPVVVSKEITWVNDFNKADVSSVPSIVAVMDNVWKHKKLIRMNQNLLIDFSNKAQKMWLDFVLGERTHHEKR